MLAIYWQLGILPSPSILTLAGLGCDSVRREELSSTLIQDQQHPHSLTSWAAVGRGSISSITNYLFSAVTMHKVDRE